MKNYARGESHGNTRLTEAAVRGIRRRHKAGENVRDLAEKYQVGTSTIYRIVLRQVWAHVPEEE